MGNLSAACYIGSLHLSMAYRRCDDSHKSNWSMSTWVIFGTCLCLAAATANLSLQLIKSSRSCYQLMSVNKTRTTNTDITLLHFILRRRQILHFYDCDSTGIILPRHLIGRILDTVCKQSAKTHSEVPAVGCIT